MAEVEDRFSDDSPGLPPPPEPSHPVALYQCQRCSLPHRYTREYSVPFFFFALVIIIWSWKDYFYCPRCMRLHLLLYIFPNMFLATLWFPVILVTWFWVFLCTFSRRPFVPKKKRAR